MELPRSAHLVGIGGAGMSSLAHCLLDAGVSVTGSDLTENDAVGALRRRGVVVARGHDATNLPLALELVVRSAAVPEDNPEVAAARQRDVMVLKFAEMVGRLMRPRRGIAVAGCHGKTTTTAMIAWILERAGLEPSVVCGGSIIQFGRGGRLAPGRFLVAEACEYARSFHHLEPECAVITNIEADHLDYYGSLEEIVEAYRVFAAKAPFVVASRDSDAAASIARERKGELFSLYQDADWRARSVQVRQGRWSFEVLKYGRACGSFTMMVPGLHNVANALAAIAVATWAGVGQELVQVALAEFDGVERRLQVLGEVRGVLVIDDYGHHPTEVAATLRAVRERYPERKIWCVFQPHQHARTRVFLKEFARAFGDADVVLLPQIYAAREGELERRGISSQALARLLDKSGRAALFLPALDEVVQFVRAKIQPGTVLVTMGAGNVYEVARRFLAESAE